MPSYNKKALFKKTNIELLTIFYMIFMTLWGIEKFNLDLYILYHLNFKIPLNRPEKNALK